MVRRGPGKRHAEAPVRRRRQRERQVPTVDARARRVITPETLLAALNDDADRLRDLLSRGAGTECRTETGATPLICAAAKGADAAVEVLLECDANVVATDKLGANCLTLAACHGHVETARAILASRRVRETDGALEALLNGRPSANA